MTELGAKALFFFLAASIIGFTVLMLFSRNFVHSALYVAAALLSFAGLYALLHATFIALLQVFVYAGAVSVLVIFVIMMVRPQVGAVEQLLHRQRWFASAVVAVFAVGLLSAVTTVASRLPARSDGLPGSVVMAEKLFTVYAVPFELASLVLLGALVGAIYLSREA